MEKMLPAIPAKRYFTIGEVSELCGVKPYVLRYWEQEFTQLKPMKRRGNRRYYQHHEVLLIRRIRELLYDQGFTINGARNRLADAGALRAELAAQAEAMGYVEAALGPEDTPEFAEEDGGTGGLGNDGANGANGAHGADAVAAAAAGADGTDAPGARALSASKTMLPKRVGADPHKPGLVVRAMRAGPLHQGPGTAAFVPQHAAANASTAATASVAMSMSAAMGLHGGEALSAVLATERLRSELLSIRDLLAP
jgi:DNA-binding transcriptional MerR regulator